MSTARQTAERRFKCALICLQWSLGIVVLIEAILFLFGPGSRNGFASIHMPKAIRLILGWGEITGALFVLIPWTVARGAWLLLWIFVLALFIHLLHGMLNVGNLVIYSAAAWVVASAQGREYQAGSSSD